MMGASAVMLGRPGDVGSGRFHDPEELVLPWRNAGELRICVEGCRCRVAACAATKLPLHMLST
ncbi:hypothetical protein, partial [Dactylosporangium sp. NPDC005555]|uniref:hypothetical protein n=1 Tax=Dactylosporangium sp. NPDC005555 TaxID=3154889 RepID=UPI0033BEFEE3